MKKVLMNFTMSDYVCMLQLGNYWTDFHEIWYWGFTKFISFSPPQICLESDSNSGCFIWRHTFSSVHRSNWIIPIYLEIHSQLFDWGGGELFWDVIIQAPFILPLQRSLAQYSSGVFCRSSDFGECARIVTLCIHFLTFVYENCTFVRIRYIWKELIKWILGEQM